MTAPPDSTVVSALRPTGVPVLQVLRAFLAQALPGLRRGADQPARICVGYSGGLDSTVLVHALHALPLSLPSLPGSDPSGHAGFELSAVHIHHGLVAAADTWAAQVTAQCAVWGVPLVMQSVAVTAGGQGIEAAARDARKAVFASLPVDAIVLAQHQGDQAETVLFRLLRGAGSRGLSGMRARLPGTTAFGREAAPQLWRPLLTLSRAQLLAYAKTHDLRWVEDPSNADVVYTRNFLRQRIFPLLRERFPAVESVLARTAEQLAEDTELLEVLAALDTGEGSETGLACARLRALSPARARNVLRTWLAKAGVFVDRARLDDLWRQALAAPDAHPLIQIGARRLRRAQGVLYWETADAADALASQEPKKSTEK